MNLKVVIEPGEDGGFVAHVPALRGCWSQGQTRDEALNNIREAAEVWLETEQDKADLTGHQIDVELITI
jgi:predicted RNase H-like HicB family nuclease